MDKLQTNITGSMPLVPQELDVELRGYLESLSRLIEARHKELYYDLQKIRDAVGELE
jgi:hypothetical protein